MESTLPALFDVDVAAALVAAEPVMGLLVIAISFKRERRVGSGLPP